MGNKNNRNKKVEYVFGTGLAGYVFFAGLILGTITSVTVKELNNRSKVEVYSMDKKDEEPDLEVVPEKFIDTTNCGVEVIKNPKETRTKEYSLDDQLILPRGLDTIEELNIWSLEEGFLVNDSDMDMEMRISDYVNLIDEIMEFKGDYPKLLITNELPEKYKNNEVYRRVHDKGYLSLFKKEEIEEDVLVTINHFTRIMSSVVGVYEPYYELEEDMQESLLSEIRNLPDELSECKRKKYLHLLQSATLPMTYAGEHPANRVLNKQDFIIMNIFLIDKINAHENFSDDLGCVPCLEEKLKRK